MTLRPWLLATVFGCSGYAAHDAPGASVPTPAAAASAEPMLPAAASTQHVQRPTADLPPPTANTQPAHSLGDRPPSAANIQPAHSPAAAGAPAPPPPAAAACKAFIAPADCELPSDTEPPRELRCTGLYGDWKARELACGVRAYTPSFELWSDGAHKRRFVWLPEGSHIDATDPDAFVYPVGTQFWKEFTLDSASGDAPLLGETRLLRKTTRGWLFTSYVWSRDGQSAIATNAGVRDLFGTGHDVPQRSDCNRCHKGRADFILGWDLLLLGDGATGITRELLQREGILQHASAAALASSVPGDAIEGAALGYLHVNCGVSCHNALPKADANDVGFQLRLDNAQLASVHETPAVRTGINQTPTPAALSFVTGTPFALQSYYDLRPLDSARSLVTVRMGMRGLLRQMPPIATNRVDTTGLQLVTAWVEHMDTARGYPAPAP